MVREQTNLTPGIDDAPNTALPPLGEKETTYFGDETQANWVN